MHRNLQIIRTDYLTRINIYVDANARELSGIDVELPGQSVRIFNINTADAWDRVLAAVEEVRCKYNGAPALPLSILQPFVHVIAFDTKAETVAQSLGYRMEVAEHHPEHMVRVEALTDAWDLLQFLDGKPNTVRFMN